MHKINDQTLSLLEDILRAPSGVHLHQEEDMAAVMVHRLQDSAFLFILMDWNKYQSNEDALGNLSKSVDKVMELKKYFENLCWKVKTGTVELSKGPYQSDSHLFFAYCDYNIGAGELATMFKKA